MAYGAMDAPPGVTDGKGVLLGAGVTVAGRVFVGAMVGVTDAVTFGLIVFVAVGGLGVFDGGGVLVGDIDLPSSRQYTSAPVIRHLPVRVKLLTPKRVGQSMCNTCPGCR